MLPSKDAKLLNKEVALGTEILNRELYRIKLRLMFDIIFLKQIYSFFSGA